MPDPEAAAQEPLATVTHARLRAAQGDAGRAIDLLRAILARDPEAPGARSLYERLCAQDGAEREARIQRLATWLLRIRHGS